MSADLLHGFAIADTCKVSERYFKDLAPTIPFTWSDVEQYKLGLANSLYSYDATRIEQLQAELQDDEAILVNKFGSWPGEYVATCEELLYWLTGFSGSAGSALISKQQAILFVDGRYVEQVKVECPHMLAFNIKDKTPQQWLLEQANIKNLHINAWATSISSYEILNQALQDKLAVLPYSQDTFIAKFWQDRPPLPLSPIWQLADKYNDETAVQKLNRYQEFIEKEQLYGYLITDPSVIAWVLNIRAFDISFTPIALSFLLICKDKIYWYVDKLRVGNAVVDYLPDNIQYLDRSEFFNDAKLDYGAIGADKYTTVIAIKNKITNFKEMEDPGLLWRAKKGLVQIKGAEEAHKIDSIALAKFLSWLQSNVESMEISELSAEAKLDSLRISHDDCLTPSFNTISAYGAHAALPHYHSTEASNCLIGTDSIYLVDSGGQYYCGTTDITRSYKFGKATEAEKKAYTLVLKGLINISMIEFKEGIFGNEIDICARKFLREHNMDYDHGTGHGVGSCLGVHEGRYSISPRTSAHALCEGMIVSLEPGYYEAEQFGIRIENLAVIKKKDDTCYFETLTYFPIQTSLIDLSLMSEAEKSWLNSYHKKCYEITSKMINDDNVLAWLQGATSSI